MPHVFAYLDLASGSLPVQAAIAGLAAVQIVLRRQISRGARALRRHGPGTAGKPTPTERDHH